MTLEEVIELATQILPRSPMNKPTTEEVNAKLEELFRPEVIRTARSEIAGITASQMASLLLVDERPRRISHWLDLVLSEVCTHVGDEWR